MKVTATLARQHFAALLERAVAGEEIAIERHGRVVARFVPAAVRAPLPVAAPIAAARPRGAAPESAVARLFRGRAERRLAIARPRAEAAIEEIVRAEMGDFPFDLLYADRLPAGLREHVAGGR